MFDLSGNGSLADEAALLTGIAAVMGAMTGTIVALVRRDVRRNHSKLEEVADTLNRVDEDVEPGQTPSLGQRVVGIERQVTSIQESVTNLAVTMSEHIHWEQRKADRIDRRLDKVESTLVEVRECMEKHHPDSTPSAPQKPTRRSRPAK